jgi:rhodanese-related sulfurtransferase
MEIIKQYKVVIMVVLPILILVIFRLTGTNHFRPDSKKLAEPSVMKSNIITVEKLVSLPGEKLLINLDEEKVTINNFTGKTLNIPADSVLVKNNLKTLDNNKGPLLLYSSDPAVSARIWMVLRQMGINNIYILTGENDNEVFKYKFGPDTLVRPDLYKL